MLIVLATTLPTASVREMGRRSAGVRPVFPGLSNQANQASAPKWWEVSVRLYAQRMTLLMDVRNDDGSYQASTGAYLGRQLGMDSEDSIRGVIK